MFKSWEFQGAACLQPPSRGGLGGTPHPHGAAVFIKHFAWRYPVPSHSFSRGLPTDGRTNTVILSGRQLERGNYSITRCPSFVKLLPWAVGGEAAGELNALGPGPFWWARGARRPFQLQTQTSSVLCSHLSVAKATHPPDPTPNTQRVHASGSTLVKGTFRRMYLKRSLPQSLARKLLPMVTSGSFVESGAQPPFQHLHLQRPAARGPESARALHTGSSGLHVLHISREWVHSLYRFLKGAVTPSSEELLIRILDPLFLPGCLQARL